MRASNKNPLSRNLFLQSIDSRQKKGNYNLIYYIIIGIIKLDLYIAFLQIIIINTDN